MPKNNKKERFNMLENKRWYTRRFTPKADITVMQEVCYFANYHGLAPDDFKVVDFNGMAHVLYLSSWELGNVGDSGLRKFGQFFIQIWTQMTNFLIPNYLMARLKKDQTEAIRLVRSIFESLHSGAGPISMNSSGFAFSVEFPSGTKDDEFLAFARAIEDHITV